MSDKRIIDLELKQAIGSGDYVAIDSAQGTYKADAESNIITPLTNVRNNVANSSASPDKYSSSTAYKVGDMVIQDDILYKCTTACSAASWAVNSACFTATTLASVVTQLNNDLNDVSNGFDNIYDFYGSKNLLLSSNRGYTSNVGINVASNSDGSVTISGTATGQFQYSSGICTLEPGTYKLSGCPSGGNVTNGYYLIAAFDGEKLDIGAGNEFTLQSKTNGYYYIGVRSGKSITTPITFKPMIRLASIEDDTYVPYAKTNKSLTDDLNDAILQPGTYNFEGILMQNVSGANPNILVNLPVNKNVFTNITCDEFRPSGQSAVKDTTPTISEVNAFQLIIRTSKSDWASYIGKPCLAKLHFVKTV